MTPFAKHLHQSFRAALEAKPETHGEPSDVLCEWEQSCRAESIARELAECAAFQLHQTPRPWRDLPIEVQGRFRMLAERVIRQIDPGVRERMKEQAVKDVADWMNGPGHMRGEGPGVEDIAREAIAIYESLCSSSEPAVNL